MDRIFQKELRHKAEKNLKVKAGLAGRRVMGRRLSNGSLWAAMGPRLYATDRLLLGPHTHAKRRGRRAALHAKRGKKRKIAWGFA